MTVPTAATPGAGRHAEHVTVWYRGEATWYTPSTTHPTASSIHHEECKHHHGDYAKARECGDRLGRRRATEANAKARIEYSGVPCVLKVHTEPRVYGLAGSDAPDPGYILYCAAHHTSATTYRRSPAEAEADASTWHCEWDGWEMPR
jgi:hypothetical protein